jgi:hypothetical protein
MAGFTVDLPLQIQAVAPGTVMLGPNTRVKGQLGFLGTQVDALTFSSGATGFWAAPNTRTRTLAGFLVSQSSMAQAVLPNGVAVPVLVPSGDPRIRSL